MFNSSFRGQFFSVFRSSLKSIGGTLAKWILNLLSLGGTSTVTNGTATVFKDADNIAQGMSVVSLPANEAIRNGMSRRSTVASGATLGANLTPNPFNTLGTGWTNNGDGTYTSDGTVSNISSDVGLASGTRYTTTLTVTGRTTGNCYVVYGGSVTGASRATNASFTEEAVSGANALIYVQGVDGFNGTVNLQILKQVIPTYSFYTQDGTALALYETKQTATGAVKVLTPMLSWSAGATVVAGQRMRVATTEGIHCHVQYVSGGTTDSAQPTVSTADIGAAAITDNDTTFLVLGYQTISGLFSGLVATNLALWSEKFDEATWLKLSSATVTGNQITLVANNSNVQQNVIIAGTAFVGKIWVTGTAGKNVRVAVADATDGNPLYETTLLMNGLLQEVAASGDFSVGYSGTAAIQIKGDSAASAGAVLTARALLSAGTVAGPYIPTTTTAVTRSATVTSTPIADTGLTPSYGAGLLIATPSVAGQTNTWMVSSQNNGTNHTGVLALTGNGFWLRKYIGGAATDALVSYVHVAGRPLAIIYKWGAGGMAISAAAIGSTFPVVGTNANTAAAQLGTTVETGSLGGASQFSGTISTNMTGTWNQAIDLAASMGMNVSNLVRE